MSAGIEPDPFDDPWVDPLQRDQWGRPIIMRPDLPEGKCPDVPRSCKITTGHGHYSRVSTADGWLDDGIGLSNWKVRHVALATARAAESTRGLIASCWYPTKKNPCPELTDYIDQALEQAKRDDESVLGDDSIEAADHGTAIHRFTVEARPPSVPRRYFDDVEAYDAKIAALGWKVVETEIFVVNDELRVAGSVDHLYLTPSGRYVMGDKKTGKIRPLSFAMQLAMYGVNSMRYDPETGERSPLVPDGELHPVAFIVHIPLGHGTCEMIPVDLAKAWEAAKIARAVYDLRRHAEKGSLYAVAMAEEI